jgi:hypothetical protein
MAEELVRGPADSGLRRDAFASTLANRPAKTAIEHATNAGLRLTGIQNARIA